ncbi:MAG: orotate phosphoribosyltransferase [Devosiaceae bacterium]|nr:orotate phosphoribosyltransferase [Devosiaceae bacterium MH13]
MTVDEVLEIFRSQDAILEGHFILSSGLHSPVFLQKALVYQSPAKTEQLCRALAQRVSAAGLGPIDAVVAPALGAIVPGYETARQLGVRYMWVEREEGTFALRRGFKLRPGAKVIIIEDIVTTGLSVREAVEALRATGADVIGCACLIDRSAGKADLGVPLIALAEYEVPAYSADALPPELAAIPAQKPGSRGLA